MAALNGQVQQGHAQVSELCGRMSALEVSVHTMISRMEQYMRPVSPPPPRLRREPSAGVLRPEALDGRRPYQKPRAKLAASKAVKSTPPRTSSCMPPRPPLAAAPPAELILPEASSGKQTPSLDLPESHETTTAAAASTGSTRASLTQRHSSRRALHVSLDGGGREADSRRQGGGGQRSEEEREELREEGNDDPTRSSPGVELDA